MSYEISKTNGSVITIVKIGGETMSIKHAVCTLCAAKLDIDDSKVADICPHCGTAFITEQVINSYTFVKNFSMSDTVEFLGLDTGIDFSDCLSRGLEAFDNKKYDDAYDLFLQAVLAGCSADDPNQHVIYDLLSVDIEDT